MKSISRLGSGYSSVLNRQICSVCIRQVSYAAQAARGTSRLHTASSGPSRTYSPARNGRDSWTLPTPSLMPSTSVLDQAMKPGESRGVDDSSLLSGEDKSLPPLIVPKEPDRSSPSPLSSSSSSATQASLVQVSPSDPSTSNIASTSKLSTAPVAASSPSPSPLIKAPRRKLRPLKAPITLTAAAVRRLAELSELSSSYLRISVVSKGCSGLSYSLSKVDTPGKLDEIVEQDGVTVLLDSQAIMSLVGSEMDFLDTRLEQRFIFSNPNVKGSCGCGESFMV